MFDEADGIAELFRGYLPYYLLIALPIFIIISPTPIAASHEFPVHRMQQYDLYGHPQGCRSSAVNLEARSLDGWGTSRHCVVAALQDLTVDRFQNVRSKAGALLVVLPKDVHQLSPEEREHLTLLESAMLAQDVSIPVYFATWTPELQDIVSDISNSFITDDKAKSALESMVNSIAANGYQIVVTGASHATKSEIKVATLQGKLSGHPGLDGKIHTIAIVAHYDSFGVAPELSMGADSNASGVAMLMELVRLFSHLYSTPSTVGRFNIIFLLTGAGKMNYLGTKKWLEDQLEALDVSIIQDASYVMCLDSMTSSDSVYMHVSKPPKDNPANTFYNELKIASDKYTDPKTTVEGVHKKINLADEILAWEHERFSIKRIPAFTLSTVKSHREHNRSTILDTLQEISLDRLTRHTQIVADALASHVYNISASQIFTNSLKVEKESLKSWMDYLATQPRSPQLLVDKSNALVNTLKEGLSRYLKDVRVTILTPDKRDPDFMFFEGTKATVNVYSVKPAVFDLVLTFAIALYLGVVYLFIQYFPHLYGFVCQLTDPKQHAKTN